MPLATLTPAIDSLTLGPFNGETGVLQVGTQGAAGTATNVNADLIASLIADPVGLYFEVATFDLVDENGIDFAFLAEITNSRTGQLIIVFWR